MEKRGKIILSVAGALVLLAGLFLAFYFLVLPKLQQDKQITTGLVTLDGAQYYYDAEGVQQYGLQQVDGKTYYFDPISGQALRGWYTAGDGAVYYFGADGTALTGTQTIDGKEYTFGPDGKLRAEVESLGFTWKVENGNTYCMGPDGEVLVGLQEVAGALYYFDETGARQAGWHTIDGGLYYFNENDGRAAMGWMNADGATYYFGSDGIAVTGDVTIDGIRYSFGADGKQIVQAVPVGAGRPAASSSSTVPPAPQPSPDVPVVQAKWVEENGKTFYVDGSGNKLKGPTKVGGNIYCLDAATGERLSGWVLYGNTRYYADETTGIAKTGSWMKDPDKNDITYYLGAEGYALTGLRTLPDGKLYLFDKTTAARQSGLKLAGGKLYCFEGDNNSAITGWYPQQPVAQPMARARIAATSESTERYYFGSDYAALKRVVVDIDGRWYGFDENCVQLTGWVDDFGGHRYCFEDENGSAYVNSWRQHAEGWVYLGEGGANSSGLLTLDSGKYYLNAKGVRQRVWATMEDGAKYCFEGKDDKALTDTWATEPGVGRCYLGSDGAAYMDTAEVVEGVLYGFMPNGTLANGWQPLGGKLYLLDEDGIAQFGFENDGDKRYYLHDTEGYALTGLHTLNSAVYFFDTETAVQETGWVDFDNKKYLFADEGGSAVTGEYTEGTATYYFGTDGAAQTGVVPVGPVGEEDYYYHNKDGVRAPGWQTEGGYHYYFSEEDNRASIGWFTDIAGGGIYFFNAKGRALTGAQRLDGRNYTFAEDGKLKPSAESSEGNWVTNAGKTYFVGEDGSYVKNLQTIDDALYFFGTDGVMRTKWVTYQNKLYYFEPETGKAVVGPFTNPDDDTKHYYFGTGGFAHVGPLRDSTDALYYYDDEGVQQFGEVVTADGLYYYFDEAEGGKAHLGWYPSITAEGARYYGKAGHALTSMREIDQERYLFDDNGLRQNDWYRAPNGQLYCFNGENDRAITGEYTAGGNTYLFTEDGVALVGLQWLAEGGPLYYFDKDGVRQTSWQRIDGLRYYFDTTSGKAAFGEFTAPDGSGTYYFGSKGYVLTGVHEMPDGNTYEFDTDGRLLHKEATVGFEWKTVDGRLYYTDSAGNYYEGLETIDGVQYHFHSQGQATTTWLTLAEGLYHFDEKGRGAVGWYEEEGKAWYFGADGVAATGSATIDEVNYVFDEDGVLIEGLVPRYNQWEDESTKARYYGPDGKLVSGLQSIGGAYYYFDEENLRASGWQTHEGSRYYFGPEGGDGKAYTGWQQVEGRWHHFDETSACQLLSWQYRKDDTDGKTYTYYYEDAADGGLPLGWSTVAGARRYFFPEDGHMAIGWCEVDGEEHYFHSSGERATGVVEVDGVLCSFDDNGKRITGWNSDEDGFNYYFEGQTALTGWKQLEEDGRWYSFDEKTARQLLGQQTRTDEDGAIWTHYYYSNGTPASGWDPVNNVYRYFYPEGGYMAVGWNTIDEEVYYFAQNGQMATGERSVDGVTYNFGAEGKLPQGWQGEGNARTYYTPTGAARGWQQVLGVWYSFDEETGVQRLGRQVHTVGDDSKVYYYKPDGSIYSNTWETVEGIRRYFFADGEMAIGWETVEGKQLYFHSDGSMATGVVDIGGTLYSFGSDGQVLTEWNIDAKGNRYYFTEGGAAKGWELIGDFRYYFDEDSGVQQLGWQSRPVGGGEPDAWYYFRQNGATLTPGWNTQVDGKERYVLADGQVAVYWQEIEGHQHYFTPGQAPGLPASGWLKDHNGRWYSFGARGAAQPGWLQRTRDDGTQAGYYYFEDGSLPAAGWNTEIDETRRYVAEDGELPTGLLVIDKYQYYLEEGGVPATGARTINGKEYVFDAEGRYVAPPVITSVGHSGTTLTVAGQASALLSDKTLQYSFDGGKNWQNAASKAFAGGTSLAVGAIQIRDALGNVTAYGAGYTVPKVWSTKHGIDVSAFQGNINWAQVAASGKVDFAIIRSLYWPKGGSYYQIDPYFVRNCTEAKKYGIKVGTYLYSYAFNEAEMAEEVNFFYDSPEVKNLLATGFRFDLPIYIDYEDPLLTEKTPSNARRTDIVRRGMVLIEQISRARYGTAFVPGFYTYYYFPLDKDVLQREGYDFWLARYDVPAHGWTATSLPMWQYSSTGSIPGIKGNVDLNYLYKDYTNGNWGSSAGGGGSGSTPVETPTGGKHLLTVKNQYGAVVTDTASSILAQIVANEVGGFSSAEVYKAQAVAAQAWILFQNTQGVPAPQVGLKTPTAAIQSAVNAVAGKNITYNGAQAFTPYHAYNNGTTNTSALWGSNYPYLKAVSSPADAAISANVDKITLEQMKQRIREVYGTDSSGKYPYDYYPDPATWIQFRDVSPAGYVTYKGLTICGREPSFDYFYRTLVRYQNSSGGWVYPIASPSFSYTYANGVFTFTSKGWGHGVGMSQRGANGLATQNGYSWQDILAHYFPGTTLTDITS